MDLPKCKMIGEDGNVFAIINRVSRILKKAGLHEKEKEFKEKVFEHCKSYDAVLAVVLDYVEVE